MRDFVSWWDLDSRELSPVISAAIIHYRFVAIHPFADGNGRTGRALSLLELYRRGFDSQHLFSVDEFYLKDRNRYDRELARVQEKREDLSGWLEYHAEGLEATLESVWKRIQTLGKSPGEPILLNARQEQLLALLRDHGSMAPSEIWEAMGLSRQGAMNLIHPLLQANLIEKRGTKKSGKYFLK
jgi:Fic family protein